MSTPNNTPMSQHSETELARHFEMLSRTLPNESTTLRELIDTIRRTAEQTLNATTEYDADLWWATLRAHALVLYHDWDGAGNPVPPSEPCDLCGSYQSSPPVREPLPEFVQEVLDFGAKHPHAIHAKAVSAALYLAALLPEQGQANG